MGKYSKMEQKLREYEDRDKLAIPSDEYLLIRIDGRAFHTYTRKLNRPYDLNLMKAMKLSAQALHENLQGVRLTYTQSDEISVLITGWKDAEPVKEPALAFGGAVRKFTSLSASIVTSRFNHERVMSGYRLGDPEHPSLATFDARVWSFPNTEEGRKLVIEYFMNRQADCRRNSVSMAARSHFSHKDLMNVSVEKQKEMLALVGSPWEDELDNFKYGTLMYGIQGPLQDITWTDSRNGEIKTDRVRRNVIVSGPLEDSSQVNALVPQLLKDKCYV